MKLGLTNSLKSRVSSGEFLPDSLSSIQFWLRDKTGLTNELLETDYNLFLNGQKLNQWNDQIGTNHAKNLDGWQKPLWHLSTNSVDYNTAKHWDLTSQITATGDFTWSFRFRWNSVARSAFIGSNSTNYFELMDANTFRTNIGGNLPDYDFIELGKEISSGIWYSVHFVRKDGNMNVYVDGGAYSDIQWGDTFVDADDLPIIGIGQTGESNLEFDGMMKDVSYFNKALTSGERSKMNEYLSNL